MFIKFFLTISFTMEPSECTTFIVHIYAHVSFQNFNFMPQDPAVHIYYMVYIITIYSSLYTWFTICTLVMNDMLKILFYHHVQYSHRKLILGFPNQLATQKRAAHFSLGLSFWLFSNNDEWMIGTNSFPLNCSSQQKCKALIKTPCSCASAG